MLTGGREGELVQVPLYTCVCYLQKYYPLFPTFMRSIFHIYLFAVLASHTHTRTHRRCDSSCLQFISVECGWGEKEKGLSRRSADRRRRRGRADVLNFIDKFNVSVTFRYATSAYSVCGARSIVRSDSYRRSLYPYRSSKCLSLVLLLVLLLCYGQRIPWAKGIQTVILWQ